MIQAETEAMIGAEQARDRNVRRRLTRERRAEVVNEYEAELVDAGAVRESSGLERYDDCAPGAAFAAGSKGENVRGGRDAVGDGVDAAVR